MRSSKVKNIIITLLLLIVIVLSVFIFTNKNKEETLDNNFVEENADNNTETSDEKNNTNENDNSIANDSNSNGSTNEEIENQENYSEDDVVNYFSDMENEIDNESKIDTFKTKFKDSFISIVDFIFYDKEIKGYKFKELTSTAKLKIIASAIKIDTKIDEKIPNYKDSLNSKYQDIKSKLVMSYLDLTVSICSNHENGCEKAKEIFGEIKSKGKIGLNYIKDILGKGKNKLKDYYEIYKNS